MLKRRVSSSNNFTFPSCRTCFLFSQIAITRLVCTSWCFSAFQQEGKERSSLIVKPQVLSPKLCFCHACFTSSSRAKCKTLFTPQGKRLQEHPTRNSCRSMLPTCYRPHSKTCRSKSFIVFNEEERVLIQT